MECADIVVVNKADLLKNDAEVRLVEKVIRSVNPTAQVLSCIKGKVPSPMSLIGKAKGMGAADWGILDEHRYCSLVLSLIVAC